MIYKMYSISDELNGFTPPIPILKEELAKRYFKDQMLGNPTMTNSPEDFSIWEVGKFDTESGHYTDYDKLVLIERGKNYVI